MEAVIDLDFWSFSFKVPKYMCVHCYDKRNVNFKYSKFIFKDRVKFTDKNMRNGVNPF